MEFQVTDEQLIRGLTLFLGFILAMVLFILHSEKKPSRLISIYVLLFVGESIPIITRFFMQLEYAPKMYFSPLNFYFTFPVILYLYFKRLSGTYNFKRDKYLLIPGVIEFIVLAIAYFSPSLTSLDFDKQMGYFNIYFIPACTFIIGFSVFMIRKVNLFQIRVNNMFSESHLRNLLWIKNVAIAQIILVVCVLILNFGWGDGLNLPKWVDFSIAVTNMVYIFIVSISALGQQEVFSPQFIETSLAEQNELDEPIVLEKQDNLESDFHKMDMEIRTNKYYLQQDLNAIELSRLLNMRKRRVGELISKVSKSNFNKYINQFRVEHAKQLLRDSDMEQYTILSIGFDSGFNSKATFYATFKETVGQTPSQYRKRYNLIES